MSLESFGVEALQGVLRRLVQDLSDPTFFDFDHQASADVESNASPDASPAARGEQLAGLTPADYAELRTPIEPPTPSDFREPKAYLQYLEYRLEATLKVLESPGVIEAPVQIAAYREVLEAVEAELNRFGGPRGSQLSALYQQAVEARQELGIA